MIFYFAAGSDELHPTQSAAGKGFIQHDVPVDKAGLMAYVNALRRPPPPAELLEVVDVVESGDCRMCGRTPLGAARLDEAHSSIEMRGWLTRVGQMRTLDLIATAIEQRRTELSTELAST